MKRYSEEHEWVELDGNTATIGITDHAAEELGDITFVELPAVGATFAQGDVLVVIESVKAAADVFCPIGGTVLQVHSALEDKPELINENPEGQGWLCKLGDINRQEFDSLMTAEEYHTFLNEEE